MTAQVSDTFDYVNETYSLVGVKGTGLFKPAAHGLQPVGMCTACWRGYQCEYGISRERRLLIMNLSVMVMGNPPKINGVKAEKGNSFFTHRYQGLNLPIIYSGGVLLGSGFLTDLYVHMGFAPAWKFRKVHELIFDGGQLTAAHDRSEQMRAFREEMKDRNLGPENPDDRASVEAWIARTFSLEYR
jgi:hypothetical protein